MAERRLRVALLGCGQIADAHLQEIRKVRAAELVAVCDRYRDLAEQAAARFEVPACFDDLDSMLAAVRPEVVHVTTPAHTHAALTQRLLEAGTHVYVEKPFTLNAAEAKQVLATARRTGRSLCLGHDQLFDPIWLECRELVRRGAVGDVTHVESVLGYPLQGNFGRQVTADAGHWVRRLPGGLFQNTISHPLYRITDSLTDADPVVHAVAWPGHPGLSLSTELVVHLRGAHVTGLLLFSTRVTAQRITRVYGSRGGLEVDLDGQVIRRWSAPSLPGAFAKLSVPHGQWREGARNLRRNLWRFLKCEIHYFAGMRRLFELFYESILTGGAPPIPYDEMLRVTRLMDRIFAESAGSPLHDPQVAQAGSERELPRGMERAPGLVSPSS
jgi:predicted dehydrogenase